MSKAFALKALTSATCVRSLVVMTALAVSVMASPTATGETVVFTDEAAFLAAVTPTIVEDFEDESVTPDRSFTNVVTTNFTAQITPLLGGTSFLGIFNSPGAASDGTHYLGGGGNPWRLDFALNFPVYALAFDVISASEARTQSGEMSVVRLDLPTGEQFVMSSCPPCIPAPPDPVDDRYFFGIVSDTPFSTFSVVNTAYSDGVGFDKMKFATVSAGVLLEELGSAVTGVGPGKTLIRTVELAQTYYAVPDIPATCAVLADFVLQVDNFSTQKKPKISTGLAAQLSEDANAIMVMIPCP